MRYGVLLLAVCAFLAAPAEANAPGFQRQIAALRAQVSTLHTQIVALQKQEGANSGLAVKNDRTTRDWATCFHAVDLDQINQVWHTLVLLAEYNGFPAQPDYPRYDDGGACQRVGITR